MNQSVTDLCAEFARKTRYYLALVPIIPNDKILKVMSQEGWKRGPARFTPEQKASMIIEGGRGVPYFPASTIYNASGQDGVFGTDPVVRKEYDSARRNAATIVYGVSTTSLFSKAAALVRFHLDVSSDIPSQKVCEEMQKEGWEFTLTKYGSTLINHPKLFNAAKGDNPLEVIQTETPCSIFSMGEKPQIDLYEAAKKRLAAKAHGITI